MRLLTNRPRSIAEVVKKARGKGFSIEDIKAAVDKLSRLNYINDREFAEMWAKSRSEGRGLGRFRIERELADKGVAPEIIMEAVSGISEEAQIEKAVSLIKLKAARLVTADEHERTRKLASFLQRRGYAWPIIRQAIARLGIEIEMDE